MTALPADALDARLRQLDAERLAPVPRASHAVAIDVDDLALVLAHVGEHTFLNRMRADTAAAYGRLHSTVRRHS